jgi:hypothetical protein
LDVVADFVKHMVSERDKVAFVGKGHNSLAFFFRDGVEEFEDVGDLIPKTVSFKPGKKQTSYQPFCPAWC